MRKYIITLIIFNLISVISAANTRDDLQAVKLENQKMLEYLDSLEKLKVSIKLEFSSDTIATNYIGHGISESIHWVVFVDSLLGQRESFPDTILAPVSRLSEDIAQYFYLTDTVIELESELDSLQNDFSKSENIELYRAKMKQRRNALDEFEKLEITLSSGIKNDLISCLSIIDTEAKKTKENLILLEEKRDLYLVIRSVATMNKRNMLEVVNNFYQKCAEYDQSDEYAIIEKLSETDNLLLSRVKGIQNKLTLNNSVQFYKKYLQVLNDKKINDLEKNYHISPDSIAQMVQKRCATAGLDSLRSAYALSNLVPVAKTSIREQEKVYSIRRSFWLRKMPASELEFNVYQIATFDMKRQNELKTLSEATEQDWQKFSNWLGVGLLLRDEKNYIQRLPKHWFMSTEYRKNLESIRLSQDAIFFKALNKQLKSMGVEKSNAILRRHNKMLHPRRAILHIDASVLGDFMQLDISDYGISQKGYGNYAYGFLLGYRFNFDSTAIANGSDGRSSYIGLKYMSQEKFPGRIYYTDGGKCPTCEEDKNNPEITSIDWGSEELHLIYAKNNAYVGVGIADARFLIKSQINHPTSDDVILSKDEIDKQVLLGVFSLGVMSKYKNFSVDIYGRVYVLDEFFNGVSFSIGAGFAFQLFFLR
jgi:hypothetical protein